MSIEKEVEKMYREDAELRKKNQNRKKNSRIATIVMLVLILVVAILLAKVLGLLDTEEDNNGGVIMNGSSVTDSASDSMIQAADSSEGAEEREYDHIKVSGSTYLYKGSEVTLKELQSIFAMDKMDKDVVVVIEDDNATEETMNDLTKLFDSTGRGYMRLTSVNTEASKPDTSSGGAQIR